jgi:hypothetical protein
MRLSREEEVFLRHWMYEEVHYLVGPGPAKRLQREHGVLPAELATLIAAAIPEPAEQGAAGDVAPTEPPIWPWSEEQWRARLAEARTVLAEGSRDANHGRHQRQGV